MGYPGCEPPSSVTWTPLVMFSKGGHHSNWEGGLRVPVGDPVANPPGPTEPPSRRLRARAGPRQVNVPMVTQVEKIIEIPQVEPLGGTGPEGSAQEASAQIDGKNNDGPKISHVLISAARRVGSGMIWTFFDRSVGLMMAGPNN